MIGIFGLAAANPASAAPIFADWFRADDSSMAAWKFSEVDGDPLRVSIRRVDAVGAGEAPRRRIFVLFPRSSSAYDTAITKMLHVFEEKNINAEITVVNYDKNDALAMEALERAEMGGYELIFSMGSQSTAWLWENYRGGDIPVISVCSKDPVMLGQIEDYEVGSGTNFAFTSLNMPVHAQMTYVLALKPNLKNIGILVNSKNVSAMQTQAQPISNYARRRGIQVLDIQVEDPEQASEELARKVSAAVATMRKSDPTLDNSVFWITGSTAVFREIATINANSDRVPVLSVVPEVVQAGDDSAVLSIGISFQSNAHIAAIYGADVLEGRAEAGDLHVGIVSPPDIAINFRKAREIALEIPFSFFESASYIYDYEGRMVRKDGKAVTPDS
jgi:putative ABC transport system substrate-binding protein